MSFAADANVLRRKPRVLLKPQCDEQVAVTSRSPGRGLSLARVGRGEPATIGGRFFMMNSTDRRAVSRWRGLRSSALYRREYTHTPAFQRRPFPGDTASRHGPPSHETAVFTVDDEAVHEREEIVEQPCAVFREEAFDGLPAISRTSAAVPSTLRPGMGGMAVPAAPAVIETVFASCAAHRRSGCLSAPRSFVPREQACMR